MIFKSRQSVPKVVPTSSEIEGDFYLTYGLTETQISQIDALEGLTSLQREKVASILEDHAERFGRESESITLLPSQVDPVLLAFINPRFFLGDEPGLGKTVMSAASYAFYRVKVQNPSKCLVVTDAPHVVSFAEEWRRYGLNMVAWIGRNPLAEIESYGDRLDGVVVGWDTLRTNAFLEYYVAYHKDYQYSVWDETSRLIGDKTITYKIANALLNEFGGGVDRSLFLNGSSFEKSVYDYYYQFRVLKPKLIPSKSWLDKRYVVKKVDSVYRKDAQGKVINQKYGEIVDFKNQAELKERLKYYYRARSKEEFASGSLPEHQYTLHICHLTPQQTQLLTEHHEVSVINSPSTMFPNLVTSYQTCPKIRQVVDHTIQHLSDRPVLYVFNRESQEAVKNELEVRGVAVEVMNGSLSSEEKKELVNRFNGYQFQVLILNVRKAINLPTSNRLIFYDVPTMPQTTGQIKARIDRNNYTTVKHYDFFVYLHSPEMVNLVRLGHFRENHANLFTGQFKNTYQQLVDQLSEVLTEEESNVINQKVQLLQENPKLKFEDVKSDLDNLLSF